jgi:hypothetical protein
MKQNLFWANDYARNGELKSSTPFQSIEDAIKHTESTLAMYNQCTPETLHFHRINTFQWGDKRGYTIRIERTGSPFLYMRDAWDAISANYTDYIPRDEWFINLLLEWFGLDTSKLDGFAEEFYAHHFERIFCEEYIRDIENQ